MSAVPQSTAGWQTGFLSILPALRTHAQIQFMRWRPDREAEAVQEAIAAACVSLPVAGGPEPVDATRPGTVEDFAAKHVRNGRHVGGRQDSAATDVLSPTARRRGRVRVVS